jgi:hypothetical protein
MERFLLRMKARIEALITEREGMIAENKQREITGDSMAYNFEHFKRISDELFSIENSIIQA